MNTALFSFASRLPFVLICLILGLPSPTPAQDVPVVTENQFLDRDKQGDTTAVPIRVQDLNEAAEINAVDLELSYGTPPVDFVKFATDETLLESWLTDQSDDETDSRAALSGASNAALGDGADGGILVYAVFEVTNEGRGTVTFPDVRFNDVNPPEADLGRAHPQVVVGTPTTISEAREEGIGAAIAVQGTVTRALGSHLWFQDKSGSTGASGLTVRQRSGPLSEAFQEDVADGTIAPGTEITVRGTLSEDNDLLRIGGADLASYSVHGQGPGPSAQHVPLSDLTAPGGADYESELIRVDNISFEDPNATGGTLDSSTTYVVVGEDGTTLDYRVGRGDATDVIGASIPQGTFTYEGVLGRSNSRFALVPVRRSTGLPVELTRFEAVLSGGTATLTWHTAHETENAGFYVQHRPPRGTAWGNLEFVESNATGGTADTPRSYRFQTETLSPGLHRFRLRQVDLDGTATFSDPIRVQVPAERAPSLTQIGPHPVREATRFRVTIGRAGVATVTLYDALGRRVRQVWTRDVAEGTRHVVDIRIPDLPSGTYFARLATPGGTNTRRLVVVH